MAKTPKAPKDQSVDLTRMVGRFPHKAAAQRECAEYENPGVFTARSAVFPDPLNFDVTVKIVATPFEVKDIKSINDRLSPFRVQLNLTVTGQPEKVARWVGAFERQLRSYDVL